MVTRTRKYAAELVELQPDVVLAEGTTVLGSLLEATRRMPIVFCTSPIRWVAASSTACRGLAATPQVLLRLNTA